MIIPDLHIDIAINYYLMIDTYTGMKTKFYCGYVHYIDEKYIHLCDKPYESPDWTAHKVSVAIYSITRIIIRDVLDTDLGI